MKPVPWREGMLAVFNVGTARGRVLQVRADGRLDVWYTVPGERRRRVAWSPDTCHPDRTDPATLGALLGVVREVYGVAGCPRAAEIYIQPQTNDVGWVVFRRGRPSDTCGGLGGPPKWKPLAIGSTEFDALLAAYEAAP